MNQHEVTFTAVSKEFSGVRGTAHVLRDISFTVNPGELFVLLGPSGCGKSTLLNLAAGLEKTTGGAIAIGGRVVADPSNGVFLLPGERDVAMVFQSYALYPHMSVAENIAFPLTNLNPRPSREQITTRVRDTAALLQIEALLERRPGELSGGQRQRVAIGRAIVREPKLFLLDEPLSNLDARLRTEMRTQLKLLQRRLGITTLYVTHDQVEAMTLGDRIAVLHDGRIEQIDTPETIYARPSTTFVAGFIGSPAMNLLDGSVADGVFSCGKLSLQLPAALRESTNLSSERCTVGIRPEHIRLVAPGEGLCDLSLENVENIGGEYLVYAGSAPLKLVARVDTPPPGSTISVLFPTEHLRLFAQAA